MRNRKANFRLMELLSRKFNDLFDSEGEVQTYFCPGRVNLIGEHIDYLGGLVMPAAISLGIKALVRKNDLRKIRLYSTDFPNLQEIDLSNPPQTKQGKWTDFVLGILLEFESEANASGLDILFDSTLPKASGLSSSAALEVLCYYIFSKQWKNEEPDRVKMAVICQRVENNFIGVQCGIMDQFAVSNGKKNHAIQLNCNSLDFNYAPINLGAYSLVIINSNKSRALAESAYNQRLEECEEALSIIQKNRSIDQLVSANTNDLNLLENAVLKRRVKHAFTEQVRVLESAKALEMQDLVRFGQLLNASHESLQSDFEVSCSELDFIVKNLQESEYCLGARMTGAGFGGCCIALIESQKVRDIMNSLSESYREKFGLQINWYNCQIANGVKTLA